MKTGRWVWHCTGRDQKHGCFDADFDGYCISGSKGFDTQERATKAASRHRCDFPVNEQVVYKMKIGQWREWMKRKKARAK